MHEMSLVAEMYACKSCNHIACGHFCQYAWTETEKQEWDIEGHIFYTETSHFKSWLENLEINVHQMSISLQYRLTQQIVNVMEPDFQAIKRLYMRHQHRPFDTYYEKPEHIVDIWELNDFLERYVEYYEYLVYQIERHHNFWPAVQRHLEQQFLYFEPELIPKMYCAARCADASASSLGSDWWELSETRKKEFDSWLRHSPDHLYNHRPSWARFKILRTLKKHGHGIQTQDISV